MAKKTNTAKTETAAPVAAPVAAPAPVPAPAATETETAPAPRVLPDLTQVPATGDNAAPIHDELRRLAAAEGSADNAGNVSKIDVARHLIRNAEVYSGTDGARVAFRIHADALNAASENGDIVDLENDRAVSSGVSKFQVFITAGASNPDAKLSIVDWTVNQVRSYERGDRPRTYETLLAVMRQQNLTAKNMASYVMSEENVREFIETQVQRTRDARAAEAKKRADAQAALDAKVAEDKRRAEAAAAAKAAPAPVAPAPAPATEAAPATAAAPAPATEAAPAPATEAAPAPVSAPAAAPVAAPVSVPVGDGLPAAEAMRRELNSLDELSKALLAFERNFPAAATGADWGATKDAFARFRVSRTAHWTRPEAHAAPVAVPAAAAAPAK